MERFLVRTTYRAMLRSAMKIDQDPALRAVLVASPCGFYSPVANDWVAVDTTDEWLSARKAVDSFIRELNHNAEWYLPSISSPSASADTAPSSTTTAAPEDSTSSSSPPRSSQPHEPSRNNRFDGEVTRFVRRTIRAMPMSNQNLNSAFASVKMLSYVLQVQAQLPAGRVKLPDPAAVEWGFQATTTITQFEPQPAAAAAKASADVAAAKEAAITSSSSSSVDVADDGGDCRIEEALAAKEQEEKGDNKAAAAVKEEDAAPNVQDVGETEDARLQRLLDQATRAMAMLEQIDIDAAAASSSTSEDAAAATAIPTMKPSGSSSSSSNSNSGGQKIKPKKTALEAGLQLAVAHPLMHGFFRHAIVMMTQFGPTGALGFVINKPVINDEGLLMPVWAFIPSTVHSVFNIHLRNNAVMIGGPVASPTSRSHSVFLIHRIAGITTSTVVGDGVFLSGDFDAIQEALDSGRAVPSDVMVVLGYCGWGPTQLEGEIERGSWLTLTRPWTPTSVKQQDQKEQEAAAPAATTTTTTLLKKRGGEEEAAGAAYVFSHNVIVNSDDNVPVPAGGAAPLEMEETGDVTGCSTTIAAAEKTSSSSTRKKSGGKKTSKKSSSSAATTSTTRAESSSASSSSTSPFPRGIGEPRRSWARLFSTVSPQHRAMVRLADVRVEPLEVE